MTKKNTTHKKQRRRNKNIITIAALLVVIIGIPFLFINYQANRSGLSRGDLIRRILSKSESGSEKVDNQMENTTGEEIDFLDPVPIGQEFTSPPLIAHVQAVDLDKDSLLDVVLCDDKGNFVSWIRQYPAGTYTESILAGDLIAPAHVQMIDFDMDGDNDLIVAVLGMLAVAQFGYDDGETRWIENLGNWKFQSHILQYLSGPINVEIVDIDNDNDLDIISLVSQEWEEIYCYINDGTGQFQPNLLFGSSNQDYGSSGISLYDLDQDQDVDILYTNGDAFDYIPPQGRPWHGVQWLENKGNLDFEFHRLCNFTGASNVRAADIDNDGDIDMFVVSAFNIWEDPASSSFIWLENTGGMQFVKRDISKDPTHLLTCEPGDFNNDGLIDAVTGGMHTYPPFDRMGRITLWLNNGSLTNSKR
jgi:hypothetical protein